MKPGVIIVPRGPRSENPKSPLAPRQITIENPGPGEALRVMGEKSPLSDRPEFVRLSRSIGIRLSDEVAERLFVELDAAATRQDVSRSMIVERMLREYFGMNSRVTTGYGYRPKPEGFTGRQD